MFLFAVRVCGFPPPEIDELAFINLVETENEGYSIGVKAGDRLQYSCESGLGIVPGRNPLVCGIMSGEWVAPYPDCTG